jgi:protein-tyrosine phosphatase
MIDIHSHLLPGVDDGSPSVEVSVPVLERFADEGVEVLVCTPHLNASDAHNAPYDHHVEILETLRAHAPSRIELKMGWEIMLDLPDVDLRARHLGLGGSTAVLVEFPRTGVPQQSGAELARLRMSGIIPVLAHPERYWGCTVDQVRRWRNNGAVIQTDAAVLLARNSMAKLARELLEEGLVDCLASDNHGDSRSLRGVVTWLEEMGCGEQAMLMTQVNPGKLLANEPVLPVAAIPSQPGFLDRLRELVFRRPKE